MTALRDTLAHRLWVFITGDESPTDADMAWADGLAGLALAVVANHELGEALPARVADTLRAVDADLGAGTYEASLYDAAARRVLDEVVVPALAGRDRSFDAALRDIRVDRDTAIARAQQLERDRDITVRERDEAVTRAELAEADAGRLRKQLEETQEREVYLLERLETAEQPAGGA